MGDFSVIPCRLLAGYLVKRGIACFVPLLSVHSARLPKTMKADYPYLPPEAWVNLYRVSVVDIRQITDWAETREELDASRVGVMGISFGGIVSSIAMAVEPRIGAGVFIVTGGNSFRMTRLSRTSGYRDRYRLTDEEYRAQQDEYYGYLAEVEKRGYGRVLPPRASYLNDPLTFAGLLKDRPVLMLNARRDKYIPAECTAEFREACGSPPIVWFPTGHVTLWTRYFTVRRYITAFLEAHLSGGA
jgi:pimeloyl-ACP methyl ester carboxylesterase